MQSSLVLLVVTIAIAGAWPSSVSVEPKNVAEKRPQVKGQQSCCINDHCRVLLNQIRSEGRYSSIQSYSQCQNNYCQDVLDVTCIDGRRITYVCNNNGCSERGGGGTVGSVGYSNNGNSPQQSSPRRARPAGVVGSTMNQPGSDEGLDQSAYKRQAAQNSYNSTAYYRPRQQGSGYGTATSDSACQSPYCTDLVNRIKVDGGHTSLRVDSSCVNGQCGDTVSVVFFDGTRQTYDCNSYGCSLREKVSIPEPSKTDSSINDQPYDISRCSTVPCRDLINKLNAEVVYSGYNVTTSCDSSTSCIDTINILYGDNTVDVFTCNVDGCQIKGSGGQYPVAATTPPEMSSSTKPTRPRPTKRRRTKPTTTTITTTEPTTVFDYDVEVPTTNSTPRVNGCLLPSDLSNAQFCPSWCVWGCQGEGTECHLRPGTTTQLDTVRVHCAPGHALDDERRTLVPCHNGQWFDEFPKCLALCPPLKSDTMVVECWLGGREVDCGQSVKPGTHASLQCLPSHSLFEYLQPCYDTDLICCQDGRWSYAGVQARQL